MIINNLENFQKKENFVIIIGSGPAGIASALAFEKKKIECLVIEAGDQTEKNKNLEFLKGKFVGDNYNHLETSRLRVFGGTGNHWGGNCNPMKIEDFEDWPINFNDLNVFKNEAKKILNLKNDFFLEKYNENLNLYNLDWSDVKFGKKYFNHFKKSKYIHLSLNTIFQSFNGKNGNILSLNCFKNKNYKLKSKYFILSCGGIENSRLLLWSQNKNPKLFNHSLPIGNYYMDHPFNLVGDGIINYKNFKSYNLRNNIKNAPLITCNNSMFLSCNRNFLNKMNILNSGLYIGIIVNMDNNLFKQLRCVAPNFIKNIYEKSTVKENYQITVEILQEQKALYDRKIILGKELDPIGMPLPEVHWWKTDLERYSARIIAEEFGKILVENQIGRIGLEEYLFNKEDYNPTVGYHQLGGTIMGNDYKDSVVDKNLKVHGFKNLFINGSSVFTTGSHVHPTYTIVLLATRLSNYISKL